MPRKIAVFNGPNLNRLGTREPEIYGTTTLADIEVMCREAAGADEILFRQSNAEHELVNWIHDAIDGGVDGLIINPAAFTFYSRSLADALKLFSGPLIELHISNVHARGEDYRHSLVSPVATAVLAGLGARGYALAIRAVQAMLDDV